MFLKSKRTFKLLSKCIDAEGFSGTKRYLGDLGKILKTAGSNAFTEGGLDRKISLIVIRVSIRVRVTDDQVYASGSAILVYLMNLFRGKVKEVTLEKDEMKKCMGLMMNEINVCHNWYLINLVLKIYVGMQGRVRSE
nr:vacuolar protein sorting-associated protein 13 domain-containing protein [Tanacetum cinerariifolium]